MPRKFHRAVVQVEVLAEDPIDFSQLSHLAYMIEEGDWSGDYSITEHEEVDGPRMAELLMAQGSDPSFFRLTEEGADEDEEETSEL